jgi:hypothetical protein
MSQCAGCGLMIADGRSICGHCESGYPGADMHGPQFIRYTRLLPEAELDGLYPERTAGHCADCKTRSGGMQTTKEFRYAGLGVFRKVDGKPVCEVCLTIRLLKERGQW